MSERMRSYVKTPRLTNEIKATPTPPARPVINISACPWYGEIAEGLPDLMNRCIALGMPYEAAFDLTVDVLKRAAAHASRVNMQIRE